MNLFPDMRSFLLLTFQSKLPVRSPAHSNLKIDEFIQKVRKMSDQAGLTFKVAELLLDELGYQEIILQIQHHSLIKTKIKNPLNFVMAIKMSLGIPDNTDKKFVVWKRNYYSLKQSILTLMSLEYESFHTTHQSIKNLVHHFFKNPAVKNTLKLTSVDTLNIIKRMYQQSERMFTQGILKTKPSFYLHKKLEYYFNTNIHIQTLEEGLHGIFPNLGERMAILDSLTKYLQSSIHHNNYWGVIEGGNTTYNKQLENILILGRNEGLSLQKCYDFIKTMVLNAQQDEVEQEYTILLEQLQSILTMKPPRNLMIHLISPSTPEIEGFSVIKQVSGWHSYRFINGQLEEKIFLLNHEFKYSHISINLIVSLLKISVEKIKTELFLQSIFNDPTARFREGQWEAIDALVNHRRKLLVVQRTGWGKSLVYFLSAKIFRERNMGLTLIISPLIALMRNQVFTAKRLGVIAETLNSTESRQEQNAVIARTLSNQVDCLLITPERLANDYFIHQVLLPIANRISLIVVDEAHCISDWGHDFRPDYKRIVQILRHLPPNTAVLGTTATANNRVIQDVQRQLGEIEISRGSLTRKSIALQTLVLPSKADRLAWLVHVIPTLPGVGIIYTLTIRDAEQVAAWLQLHNIDAKAYYSRVGSTEHDEFNHAYRESLEQQFLENKIKVLVATVALGMGYDKPDIHFVIHYQTPSSIVAYYQQVGRAGRDIDHALGILMFGGNNGDDDKINQYFRRQSFPSVEHVKQILKLLENEDGVSIFKIEEKTNLPRKTINNVLRFLSVENPAPVIEKIAPSHPQKKYKLWMRTAVPYHLDQMRITEFVRQREQEWIEIKDYVSNQNQCRMNYLQYALDDTKNNIIPCGKCDICRQQPVINTTIDPYKQSEAENFLTNHSVDTITLRTKVPAYVFLKEKWQGGDLPLNLRAEEGFVLSHAEDTLWGKIVTREKYNNYFSDELVLALVRMIQKNWHILSYRPTWVCCVPSHNNIHLVSNFAERVAQKLSLPFFNIVNKIRKNSPQKEHQNEINQCKNLDGVFTANVPTEVQNHPVLLIDDIIDSGWTLTVVAAKLRQAGSGPVYPIALTSIAINESS